MLMNTCAMLIKVAKFLKIIIQQASYKACCYKEQGYVFYSGNNDLDNAIKLSCKQ